MHMYVGIRRDSKQHIEVKILAFARLERENGIHFAFLREDKDVGK